jgi:hypothetical protein
MTQAAALAARLVRLAVEAQPIADQLAAAPLNDVDTELLLAPAAAALATMLDTLEDSMYRADKLDQSHCASDLAHLRRHTGLPPHRLAA